MIAKDLAPDIHNRGFFSSAKLKWKHIRPLWLSLFSFNIAVSLL